MITDSGLINQASKFADSLNVREAPSTEKTAKEETQEFKTPEQKQGDTVAISEDARALAAVEDSEKDNDQTLVAEDPEKNNGQAMAEKQIQMLKDQIERLEEEIKAIQEDERLSQKQKIQLVQAKQVQLMELNKQLADAQEKLTRNIGATPGGGTRAEGVGGSLKDF